MANHRDDRPLSDLVAGLVSDISGLFRKEIELAKTEASEKMSHAIGGIEMLLIGLVFAIGAIGVLLAAAVSGLSAFLIARGIVEPTADALSSILIGALVAILAGALISRGLTILRGSNLKLDRTVTSLRQDANVIRETKP
ncbi:MULTISPECIES: phage holin family protein [unclassified Sinorhizobium]|uniref:phage holin family protein n=1 Tax=unclassified Sinorhizobium TaxID=2613772 RepID=UPI003523B959